MRLSNKSIFIQTEKLNISSKTNNYNYIRENVYAMRVESMRDISSLKIEETHLKDQHPYTYQDREADAGGQNWKVKELHIDRGKQDKGVTNCSRHCLLCREPRNEDFSAGATTKPSLGPLRARIEGFTPKI